MGINTGILHVAFWVSLLLLATLVEVASGQESQTCSTDGAVNTDGTCSSNGSSAASSNAGKDPIDYTEFLKLIEWNEDESIGILTVDWGEPQTAEGREMFDSLQNMFDTYNYMTTEVFVDDEFKKVRDVCQVRNSLCSFWAAIGRFRRKRITFARVYGCAERPSCGFVP